ncbi:MAG: hypothetical protein V4490_00070 [Pseudomonadota bacterium]
MDLTIYSHGGFKTPPFHSKHCVKILVFAYALITLQTMDDRPMNEHKFPERIHVYVAIAVAFNVLAIIYIARLTYQAQDRLDFLTVKLSEVIERADTLEKEK